MLLVAATGHAQSGDAASLARAAQNPVADLISLPFQNNTDFGLGPDNDVRNTLNIQPVWPFKLSESWNLITRTIVPVIDQPGLFPGQSSEFGLGNMTFTAFMSPRNSYSNWTWGAGPVVVLPTSTDDRLGPDKFGLGLSAVFLTQPGNWVIGSLFSNVKSVGGGSGGDYHLFTWQYFVNYNLNNGWYIVSAPINTANWKASGGDKWTMPIGGGVGKIMSIGSQPINVSAQAYVNVVKPDIGPDWQLRLQFQMLFPK